ncbi:MAG: hypothetical protein Q4A27_00300 [bacterium]|nr:hypothetical protein [bacterium]
MKNFKNGKVEGSTIVIILLSIALVGLGAFGVWAWMNYERSRTDVEGQVNLAVSEAKKQEAEEQAEKYAERERANVIKFNGPADYGGISFSYPKAWSSYVASDGSKNEDYFAYFHPTTVPPVPTSKKEVQRFALRMAIYNSTMDEVLSEYSKAISAGELSSSSVIANGKNATKLEGLFPDTTNKDNRIQGVAYFFKVNDKVLMLKTDAQDAFIQEFNSLINTVNFK